MEDSKSFGVDLAISLTSNWWCLFIRSMEGEGVGASAWHRGSRDAHGPIHFPGMMSGVFFLLTGLTVCLGSFLLCKGSFDCPLGSLG